MLIVRWEHTTIGFGMARISALWRFKDSSMGRTTIAAAAWEGGAEADIKFRVKATAATLVKNLDPCRHSYND
jgi:hypothetical protein